MSDETRGAPVPRPEPSRSVWSRANDWLAWFGLGRLVLAAVSVLVVVVGTLWLLRAPVPSVESTLPMAGSAQSTKSTLISPVSATTPPPASSVEPSQTVVPPSGPTLIVVHVAGAVVQPGVYNLASSARVVDAVDAAGGVSADADTDRVNLAAVIEDGQRIFIPVHGGTVPPEAATSRSTGGSTGGPAQNKTTAGHASGQTQIGASPTSTDPVDLNTATAEQLDLLPGIGPATAAAIVEDRERNGPFASVDDLDRVSGIGPAKLAALAELVTV